MQSGSRTRRRIALATCAHHPGFCARDDAPALEAFEARGVDAMMTRWDDSALDWSSFDAVVIRTTWDYMHRLDEFLAWAERVAGVTRLFNGLDLVRENLDKRYLRRLERAGVPIVPTAWLEKGSTAGAARDAIETMGAASHGEVVVKPYVGGGASGLARFGRGERDAAVEHAGALLEKGGAMVQTFLPTILDRGEVSVVVLDGEVSHAVRKVPSAGEFRVQIEFGGKYTVVEPTARQREIARLAHDTLAGEGGPLLYGRCDFVEPTPGEPAVIEFEAVEPELFFPLVPAAAGRLADLALARLDAAR